MTRIVAGAAGGRRLSVPRGRPTRPTAERTREGLFSTLEAMTGSLAGTTFLDLYAGSGAVGLEAASRGATRVRVVENGAGALAVLRRNVEVLGPLADRVDVRGQSVERFLSDVPDMAFDIVFLDPPYDVDVAGPVQSLVTGGWLAPDAVVVVERATRDDPVPWPPGVVGDRTRRYGDSTLWYGRRP
jgi:16S rRNA (guanine966-N2)-methyltransferase